MRRREAIERKRGMRKRKKKREKGGDIMCSILALLGYVLEWRYLYYCHSLNSFELIIFINVIHSFGRWKINSLSGCTEPHCAKSYQLTVDAFMQNFVIRICDGKR